MPEPQSKRLPSQRLPTRRLPIEGWAAPVATLIMLIGWNWDISWHRSIGRDTLWTPPHLLIYFSILLAFVVNAWIVLSHTFGRRRDEPGIRVFGFKAPVPSFVILWACLLELTGVLFDDWWHEVYGLDVGVFSPPHYFLAIGFAVFFIGHYTVIAVLRNRGFGTEALTRWLAIFIGALLVGQQMLGMDPAHGPMGLRAYLFLVTCSVILPFTFVAIQEHVRWRWAAVSAAAIFMVVIIIHMQVFKLFPATPQFGPVYQEIPAFLPPPFPSWLVAPALAVGLILWRVPRERSLLRHLLVGFAFVVLFVASNWALSAILMSPLGENEFFCAHYPGGFFEEEYRPVKAMGLNVPSALTVAACIVVAAVSSRFGEAGGRWLRGLVR